MLSRFPRLNASTGFAVRLCLAAIDYRVICIFFAAALLLVSQVKAQEKAGQVNDLVQQLRSRDAFVRSYAASALGQIGKEAVPALIAALKDQNDNVRLYAAEALGRIATALFDTKSTGSLVQLKAAYDALSTHPDSEVKAQAVAVKRTIDYFKSLWWVGARNRAVKIIDEHPYISAGVALYLLLQLTWLLFFWLRPYWLLRIGELINKANQTLTIPIPYFPISLKLPSFTLISLYQARPRVLNAWVQRYLGIVQKKFEEKRASKDRQIHIAIPAVINKTDWDANTVTLLQPHFDTAPTVALITGEGGAGKTSVAWQMAAWAMVDKAQDRLCRDHTMIPVILEGGLDAGSDGKPDLIETVRGRLENLLGEKEEKELITRLLNNRCLLVILDSFSEWDEESRKKINPGAVDFPAKALIVTSRLQEEWKKDVERTTIVMQRLKGKRLVAFMEDYLNERLKQMRPTTETSGWPADSLAIQLDEGEPLDASKQVMEMNASRKLADPFDDREITVLLAKLYAEAMIVAKEISAANHHLPRNVVELMEQSVTDLNRNRQSADPETMTVQRAVKVIAWQCLKQHHRPNAVDTSTVLAELRKETPDNRVLVGEEKPAPLSLDEAKKLLTYLEKSLRLIERTGSGSDQIRLSLDPLAEYLAGLYLVEHNRDNDQAWQAFLADAEQQTGAPQATKGFLLAVRDCCEVRGSRFGVPTGVSDAIARLVGFDSEAINAARLKQRIKLLLANLNSHDAGDRRRAADALGSIGPEAKEAVSALIDALKDQDAEVRNSTARALVEIGPSAVSVLISALKDHDAEVRCAAAEVLGRIGLEAKEVVPALISVLKDHDAEVRSNAAEALGEFGPEAKEAVHALISAFKDQTRGGARYYAEETLRKIGPSAVPVLISALKDHDAEVRGGAASALGKIGLEAKEAVPALTATVKDQDKEVSHYAILALGRMGPSAVPALISALKDEEVHFRLGAAMSLADIGASAVPALISALEDRDEYVRSSAASALARIGPSAVPALISALENQEGLNRYAAASALGGIGPEAKEAVPALISALKDQNEWVRIFAADALGKIGPEAKEAVPALIAALKDQDASVRISAAEVLGRIGPDAKDAVPALLAAFKDEDAAVRRYAAEALEKIEPAVSSTKPEISS